jgi:hypothetical protein
MAEQQIGGRAARRLHALFLRVVPKVTAGRSIIELHDYDFAWMRALERARVHGMYVSAAKVYDAINKSVADVTTLHKIMRALGCPCDDDDDDERCLVVRVVEVDDASGLIVDDHPSEG